MTQQPAKDKTASQTSSISPSTRRWTRRRVLGWTGAGLLGGVGLALRTGCYEDTPAFRTLVHFSATTGAILLRVIEAVLPDNADRSPATLQQHVQNIDAYLQGLPSEDVRLLNVLLYGVEHAPFLAGLYVRRFSRLSLIHRQRVLYDWQTSQIGLRRLGLQSLKTLVFMSYYRNDAAFRSIRYSGPIVRGYTGPEASRKRYDALLAPMHQEPRLGK